MIMQNKVEFLHCPRSYFQHRTEIWTNKNSSLFCGASNELEFLHFNHNAEIGKKALAYSATEKSFIPLSTAANVKKSYLCFCRLSFSTSKSLGRTRNKRSSLFGRNAKDT